MKVNTKNMCNWEIRKAGYLMTVAGEMEMDISGYGEIDVNPNSGYTYLWLEDYPFTLYMPINCELTKEDVYVMWSNPEDGEEIEKPLSEFRTLDNIYDWVKELEDNIKED